MTRLVHFIAAAALSTAAVCALAQQQKVAVIRYTAGSTIKVEQLVGEQDKERHQTTRSQTFSRFQIQGTDLGSSFEHEGRVVFLFGDTVGVRGILFSYAPTPWGPWSEPQIVFNAVRDGAVGRFIHDPRADPDDGLAGPVIGKGQADPQAVHGGAYAPYVIERYTKLEGAELNMYYVLSTWNPYVVVLMKSLFRID